MANQRRKFKLVISVLQIVAALFFLVQPVFATTLNSTNYRILDHDITTGGETMSSASFVMNSDIELVIDVQKAVTVEPPPGGGEEPPPPPPPPDTTPPAISNVQAINITQIGATITWDTNEAADSFVEYGLSDAYGLDSASSTALEISHSLNIVGLAADTLYHFRVRSKDGSNNQAFSGDYTFRTVKAADTTPPVISNIRVVDITGISAAILWDTNEAASSSVKYGLNSQYGSVRGNDTLTVTHRIELNNLIPDTEYYFQVLSGDVAGNVAVSENETFRTLDTIPPVISNVRVINITERSADITWVTNEGTTSQILYRRAGESAYLSLINNTLEVSHFDTLSSLIANVDYEFYIIARDAAGNTATSGIKTFKTLRDNIPPSNIRNFTATPDDTLNVLTWQNPVDPDFAGVYIVRSTSTYPRNKFEGEFVYVGPGVSFTDRGLINGVTYYYTGFSYDTSLNYSSGAITKGTPVGPLPPEEELPEEELPPEEEKPIVPGEVNLDAISFWVANRTIQIEADENRMVETLAGVGLGVSLDKNKISGNASIVTLRIDNSNYLMKLRADGSVYDTDISLSAAPGIYNGEVTLVFDNSQQVIKFQLNLKSRGMIFENLENGVNPVNNASVTLYEMAGGNWQIWSGAKYYQSNPIITSDSGAYGYLVPNGTYYLEIKKDGYRDAITNRFDVSKNFINTSIELLAKPKKIEDVVKPEATISENVAAVTKNIIEQSSYSTKVAQEEVIKFTQNPIVENTTSEIVAPSLVSVAVFNAATAIPFLNLWTYLQYLLTQPLLFLKRKKRKAWGIVYNAFTKMPLDLAIVRLIDAATKRVVRTVVTDKQGRYVLFAPQGNFILTITKPGFQFPSVYLKGRKEDEAYVDLYQGGSFDTKQDGQPVTYNIPMDPIEKKVSLRNMIFFRAIKGLQFGLALSGIVLTTVALIISPNVKLGLFLVLHIGLFVLFVRLARPAKFNKWGTVKDETGKPVKNAVVRLFEPEYNKLLGTQITDSKGHYAFLVGRNIYYLTFEKAGFKTLKTKNIDMRTRAKEAIITEKVKLEQSK
ncbi:MAG: carboxypeptidase regulatory-like domain-containing protein [Patescibacteria group bacterium]